MAMTLETAAQNASCTAVLDLLDGGTIEWQTSGDVMIAEFDLGTPAFGAPTAGSADMEDVADTVAVATGTVAKAVFKASGGGTIFTVSVGGQSSGEDIELSSVAFTSGDDAALDSYTHTQPATAA